MKHTTLAALAGTMGSLSLASHGHAVFVGLSGAVVAGGSGLPPHISPRTIYHIYANFTSPSDRVDLWGIGGSFGPGGIENRNAFGTGPGTGFINVGAPTALAPFSPGTTRDYDTYPTIGVRYGEQAPGGIDETSLSPGFPSFIPGTSFTAPPAGAAVFITPDDDQGRADYINSGSDTNLRVLLMQLVVNQGETVHGTIGVAWREDGSPNAFVAPSQMFSPFPPPPPAPAAISVFVIAGLAGSRRRPI